MRGREVRKGRRRGPEEVYDHVYLYGVQVVVFSSIPSSSLRSIMSIVLSKLHYTTFRLFIAPTNSDYSWKIEEQYYANSPMHSSG